MRLVPLRPGPDLADSPPAAELAAAVASLVGEVAAVSRAALFQMAQSETWWRSGGGSSNGEVAGSNPGGGGGGNGGGGVEAAAAAETAAGSFEVQVGDAVIRGGALHVESS
jgi:hypothetical protein